MAKTGVMKCVMCERNTTFKEIHLVLQPGSIRARAWKCMRCGEAIIESEAAQKALLLNQLQRGFQVTVGQLGNSGIFRFPSDLMRLWGLKKGKKVSARLVPRGKGSVLEITPI